MKIIITENKIHKSVERLIQSTLNSLLEDENTFDSYELETLESVDRVDISHITTGVGITVWLNIYSNRYENFDFLTSELQFRLKNLIPNIRIFTNDVITPDDEDIINEMIKLDIKVGDTLMGGKFKNKKVVVKTISKNDKGDITINGKPLLRFRLLKENKSVSDNKIVDVFKKWLYMNYDEITFLEISTYDGHPLIKIYYTTDSDAVNHDSWLAGEISDNWNTITGGKIPILPRWKFSGYNAKIVIDTEEFVDDEVINENKSLPEDKILEVFKKWLYKQYPNISHLEVTRKKDPYLSPSRFKDIPLVVVHYTESDEGGYATWQPNYSSWLVMNIVDKWNRLTNNTIPISGSFYDKIDHKNVKILVDAEEFSEDEK